jgi:hypothetical protein
MGFLPSPPMWLATSYRSRPYNHKQDVRSLLVINAGPDEARVVPGHLDLHEHRNVACHEENGLNSPEARGWSVICHTAVGPVTGARASCGRPS